MKHLIHLHLTLLLFLLVGCSTNTEDEQPAPDYSFLQWGEYLNYYGKYDSAFLMFSRAVTSTKDSLDKAKAFQEMGAIQQRFGDLSGAQQNLVYALQSLNEKDTAHANLIAYVYNELGNISIDLKNYRQAIRFYNDAFARTKDEYSRVEILNGKATALQKMGNYSDALDIYDSLLQLNPGNVALRARLVSNRARTLWLKDPGAAVLNDYHTALKIRLDSQIIDGQNASYAHFADYYLTNQPDSAFYYAQKMYEIATASNWPDDRLEAIDKMIRSSKSAGQKEYWYQLFKHIDDSLQYSRDTAQTRFALLRYEAQMKKTDNLLFQRRINRQRLLMAGLAVLALAIIVLLTSRYNKRKRLLKEESEKAIQELKLSTSKKVHDVVANGLYRIMNELEHRSVIDREPLMNQIEGLYEKSRNISYEQAEEHVADYPAQTHALLSSFSNDHTKVIVIGNQSEFWSKLGNLQKQELQLVLNELMVNMKKHSQARNVVLRFEVQHNGALVHYKDNGIGFKEQMVFGNGLKNTVSRINSLKGQIKFGETGQPGVSITISLPLETDQS